MPEPINFYADKGGIYLRLPEHDAFERHWTNFDGCGTTLVLSHCADNHPPIAIFTTPDTEAQRMRGQLQDEGWESDEE